MRGEGQCVCLFVYYSLSGEINCFKKEPPGELPKIAQLGNNLVAFCPRGCHILQVPQCSLCISDKPPTPKQTHSCVSETKKDLPKIQSKGAYTEENKISIIRIRVRKFL